VHGRNSDENDGQTGKEPEGASGKKDSSPRSGSSVSSEAIAESVSQDRSQRHLSKSFKATASRGMRLKRSLPHKQAGSDQQNPPGKRSEHSENKAVFGAVSSKEEAVLTALFGRV